MDAPCHRFRADFLARLLGGEEPARLHADLAHARGCTSCSAWAERQAILPAALRDLPRQPAPVALDERVERGVAALVENRRRIGEALRGLPRLAAPPELRERVEAGLRAGRSSREPLPREAADSDLERRPSARLLSTLTRLSAPSVLERLVSEELADPAAAVARRTAGELPRLKAPLSLEPRVDGELRRGARKQPRLLGGLVTRRWATRGLAAAAAVLLVFLGGHALLAPGGPEQAPRRYRVTRVSSLEQMPDSELTRLFASALTGGAFDAAPTAASSRGGPGGGPR